MPFRNCATRDSFAGGVDEDDEDDDDEADEDNEDDVAASSSFSAAFAASLAAARRAALPATRAARLRCLSRSCAAPNLASAARTRSPGE